MTVAELIARLQDFPSHIEVQITINHEYQQSLDSEDFEEVHDARGRHLLLIGDVTL